MTGRELCKRCELFKDCAKPSRANDPSSTIRCPYDIEIDEGDIDVETD